MSCHERRKKVLSMLRSKNLDFDDKKHQEVFNADQ